MARGIEINGLAGYFGLSPPYTSTLAARRSIFDVRRARATMDRGQLVTLSPLGPLPLKPVRRPFVMVAGQRNGLPAMRRTPQAALNGLGFSNVIPTLGCQELDVVIERLGQALDVADKQGVSSAVIESAKAFYSRETGYFSRTREAFGDTCARLVQEGTSLLQGVNSMLQGGGVPAPAFTDTLVPEKSVPAGDILSTIKTVAVAVGVLAGVILVAPIVGEVIATRRLTRR